MASAGVRQIRVEISQDGYQACVKAGHSCEGITLDELRSLVAGAGVVAGVDEAALQAVAAGRINGGAVPVAQGTRTVDGQDGWIEYFFDHEKARPVEEKDGKVDLREMHYVHNVRKGEKLARVHPPRAGVQGMTVTGEVVPAYDGQKALIHPGPHTEFSAEDKQFLLARSDGGVILRRDGTVEVLPVLTISGDVDFSTGNIDFVGSLKVLGDIKGEFTVRVRKDLEVVGGVEDARLEVGGNVTIHKGFTGAGKGILIAKGKVTVLHVLNQTIVCEKDIVVERESVNGTLKAGGRIVVSRGTIAGGTLEADEEVDVQNLGSGEHTQARVRVGRKGRLIERLGQLEKEIKHSEKQVADVKDGVFRLIRMKLDAGALPPEKEELLNKLQDIHRTLPDRMRALQDEQETLKNDLRQESSAQVNVRGTVFENVVIDINGSRKVVDTALQDVVFVERAGAVEARPRE